MNKFENIITEDTSFYSKRIIKSINAYKECLEKFSHGFKTEISLKSETNLFLDTNVLLRYYSISFTAREKLFNFINNNKSRIVITTQVQTEFLKNREDIIQRFFEQVTSRIPRDFSSDIVNKMKSFLDVHKVVLKDYPFVEPAFEKHKTELEKLLSKLNEAVELKKKEHVDLIFKDDFLNVLTECVQFNSLSSSEIAIIKGHFDVLSKNISTENMDSIISKPNGAFPGLGDIKNKPDDPYGDYFIIHEIMKHMIINKSDAIFLTFDNTKGDWMSKNRSPYLHYVQNVYANTGNILYIIDAERALEDLLNISIDSLIQNTNDSSLIPITAETLMDFVKRSRVFHSVDVIPIEEFLLDELKVNGYKYITDIEKEFKIAKISLQKYRLKNRHLNNIGIIRACLRIANPNYRMQVSKISGEISQIGERHYAEYRKYAINNIDYDT